VSGQYCVKTTFIHVETRQMPLLALSQALRFICDSMHAADRQERPQGGKAIEYIDKRGMKETGWESLTRMRMVHMRMTSATAMDYGQFYDLESYLFKTVSDKFREQGFLCAFDFFCIIIWKANRAKSKIAQKIMDISSDSLSGGSLEERVHYLTKTLSERQTPKDRLRYLLNDLKFRLPMASAILTVLYPDEFTIYDVRVCNQLSGKERHLRLVNRSDFEEVWEGYMAFKKAVEDAVPHVSGLRDKDRYLWGKSFYEQLSTDIRNEFKISKSV